MKLGKVIFAAFVIFTAGVLTGHFATNLTDRDRESKRHFRSDRPHFLMMHDLMKRMESRLDLTSNQRESLREIVEESQDRMRDLMDEIRPRFESESRSMRLKIEAILDERQMARFHKIFKHRRSRFDRKGRPHRPKMEDHQTESHDRNSHNRNDSNDRNDHNDHDDHHHPNSH